MKTPEPLSKWGILWMPEGDTEAFVRRRKEQIRQLEPDAPYAVHPVHATLLVFHSRRSPEILEGVLTEVARRHPAVAVRFGRAEVFPHDPLTGGDTLVWPILAGGELGRLQRDTAEAFRAFLEVGAMPSGLPEPQADSWKKYGFRFVGEHWLPHLTAGSPLAGGRSVVQAERETAQHPPDAVIEALSLVRIDGDIHQTVKTEYLRG